MPDTIVEKDEDQGTAEANVMDMSDEDFAKLSEPTQEVETGESDSGELSAGDNTTGDTGAAASLDGTGAEAIGQEAADAAGDPPADSQTMAAVVNDQDGDPATDADKGAEAASAIDYKAEYEKLTAPFKANGVDIKVKDSSEILSLMQMGANYHKKMTSLKPSLKILKTLEKNGLLDESKLGYLIDLSNKNPEAITKLIKDSGIDPLSVDTSLETSYVPKVPVVTDSEMALDEVLDAIKETPTYNKTLQVVAETWDTASRNAVAGNPHIISVINEQIASGIFDTVTAEVERARRFGKLTGVSDFDAYKQIGDYLHSVGQLGPVTPAKVNADPVVEAQKKVADEKRKNAKKAAAITTGAPAKPAMPKDKLLSLSDEDFAKLSVSAYETLK